MATEQELAALAAQNYTRNARNVEIPFTTLEAINALVSQGAGYVPTIGTAVSQRVTVDEGSDVNHAEVLLSFNCGPVGDVQIASQRFSTADTRSEVVKTLITGATTDGAILNFSLPLGLTNLYIGRRGGSNYTQAAGAVVTASQAVACLWSGTIPLRYCTVNIGEPYKLAGSNNRYRDLVVTAFVGV